jgi:hypothetical protein
MVPNKAVTVFLPLDTLIVKTVYLTDYFCGYPLT